MKRPSIILFFVLLVFQINFAQDYKLGKVTVQELEQKEHPEDPEAVAAYLFHICQERIEYNTSKRDFYKNSTVKGKIKVYKKDGYTWADLIVPFYSETQRRESVTFSDTYTYNLENGKIIKTKVKSEGKFEEKINKYWSRMKITFPDVKEGSIVEYEYKIESPRIFKLFDWDFQESIPVNISEYTLYTPEYFIYKPHFKGFTELNITKNTRQITQEFMSREVEDPSVSRMTQAVANTLDYREDQIKYKLEKIPALKEEPYVNNLDNYKSSITHELTQYMPPRSTVKNFSTDWETVVKDIYNSEGFGDELKKTGYFENDLEQLLNGKSTRDERIVAIFEFVKTKVKWNGGYGYYCDEGVKTAYKNNVGNAAEINIMLTAMLRHAGLEANPVLISTRSNGIAFYPSQTAFNYIISAIEVENDLILLDATEPYSLPNVLPVRALNWFGRIIRKSGSSAMVDLSPKQYSSFNHNLMGALTADGKVTGKVRRVLNQPSAYSHRVRYMNKDKEGYLENLENYYGGINITEHQKENDKNIYSPITETFSFEVDNAVDIINDKIFLSPLMFFRYKENPFKAEKREFPVDFDRPYEAIYNVIINIPDGYAVESMPEQIKISMEDQSVFSFMVSTSGNRIQLKVTETQSAPIVAPQFYESFKEYFQKMVDKQNEKIVLKKI